MSIFKKIKIKLKKELPKIEKIESSSNVLKESREIKVIGNRSKALSIWDFPIPTGICSNPVSEELKEYIKRDKLGQLLCNPINRCVFYDKSNRYCFFAGSCNEKTHIDEQLVDDYRKEMKECMESKYGPRQE